MPLQQHHHQLDLRQATRKTTAVFRQGYKGSSHLCDHSQGQSHSGIQSCSTKCYQNPFITELFWSQTHKSRLSPNKTSSPALTSRSPRSTVIQTFPAAMLSPQREGCGFQAFLWFPPPNTAHHTSPSSESGSKWWIPAVLPVAAGIERHDPQHPHTGRAVRENGRMA